ncbi:MAG: hypothetical protein CO187_10850 [Zetaproteobacteria bacterium CG_4_9_14_3_um_filter_53_7]|nr:MAG: hypothetical protein CO187_10850 [Zetaproteobacteria bacterium CG_4_9_14_3_um_filter_53_7]
MSLPQGAAKAPGAALPWPSGSILSAQVLKQDAGTATLLIGNSRYQAQTPGPLPQGNIWIQLMERGNPPQFRILSEARVTAVLAELLGDAAADGGKKMTGQHLLRQQQQEWPMPQHPQTGFHLHSSSAGNMLMIEDRHNRSTKGMVQKDDKEDRSALHGRLDLEHLGTVYFSVENKADAPMQLKLRVAGHNSFLTLYEPFSRWLEEKKRDSGIDGHLSEGDEPIIKPERSVRTVA